MTNHRHETDRPGRSPLLAALRWPVPRWRCSARGAADDKTRPPAPAPGADRHRRRSRSSASLPLRIAANGNIAAWQEASVGTEANGLRLAEVRVNVGDVVQARPGAGHLRARHGAGRRGADPRRGGRGRGRRSPRPRPTRSARASLQATGALSDAADQPVPDRRAHRAGAARRAARRGAARSSCAWRRRRCWRPTTASSRRAAPPSARCCRPGRSCSA